MNPEGILLIDKPAGISSFGVVAWVRRLLSQAAGKKIKVGHTGTLDPFASGLMIIVVGAYCKRAGEFSKLDKTYEATLELGKTSTTGDPEGEITPVANAQPTQAAIVKTLKGFTGHIQQTPPSYSAIKIDGVRAYKLARQGKAIDIPTRTVTISRLELITYHYPEVIISCDVSSGTYIRTLAEDIGATLGTGAYCTQLRRTRVAEFSIETALQLDDTTTAEQLLQRLRTVPEREA
jgi:tRNA pseudouridine55 synthase